MCNTFFSFVANILGLIVEFFGVRSSPVASTDNTNFIFFSPSFRPSLLSSFCLGLIVPLCHFRSCPLIVGVCRRRKSSAHSTKPIVTYTCQFSSAVSTQKISDPVSIHCFFLFLSPPPSPPPSLQLSLLPPHSTSLSFWGPLNALRLFPLLSRFPPL